VSAAAGSGAGSRELTRTRTVTCVATVNGPDRVVMARLYDVAGRRLLAHGTGTCLIID